MALTDYSDKPHVRLEYDLGGNGDLLSGAAARTTGDWSKRLSPEQREGAALLLGANGFRATKGEDGRTVWKKTFMSPIRKGNLSAAAADEIESLGRLERELDEIGVNLGIAVPAVFAASESNAMGMSETSEGVEIQMLKNPGGAVSKKFANAGFEYKGPGSGYFGTWLFFKMGELAEKSKPLAGKAAAGLRDFCTGMLRVSECHYGEKTARALDKFVEAAKKISEKNIAKASEKTQDSFSFEIQQSGDEFGINGPTAVVRFSEKDVPWETQKNLSEHGFLKIRDREGGTAWIRDVAGDGTYIRYTDFSDSKEADLMKSLQKDFRLVEPEETRSAHRQRIADALAEKKAKAAAREKSQSKEKKQSGMSL